MTGSAVAPATMTCCSGSSVSSAAETTKVADFSSSSIVGSVFDVLLELLVGDVGQDLLAVGTDHGLGLVVRCRGLGRLRRGGLLGRGLLGRSCLLGGLGLLGGRRRLLGGGLLGRARRGGLAGGLGRHGACRRRGHVDRDSEAAQVRQQALEMPGLDRRVLTGLPHGLGTHGAGGLPVVDECERRLGASARRQEQICARSRTRTPLVRSFGARHSPVMSRAAAVIVPRRTRQFPNSPRLGSGLLLQLVGPRGDWRWSSWDSGPATSTNANVPGERRRLTAGVVRSSSRSPTWPRTSRAALSSDVDSGAAALTARVAPSQPPARDQRWAPTRSDQPALDRRPGRVLSGHTPDATEPPPRHLHVGAALLPVMPAASAAACVSPPCRRPPALSTAAV